MADYMHLMAKLPYLGVFPPSNSLQINLSEFPEFDKIKDTPLHKSYKEFISELSLEILKIRKGETYIPKLFNEHLMVMNPLEREKNLLLLKWKFLENICPHEANNDWLWIYKEKVSLINHWQAYNQKKGEEIYKNFVEEVLKNAAEQNGT